MANRYWVGGAGTWDNTTTTNWSATSGGSGGASVPTSADSVFFDQAGTYTVTFGASLTSALACANFTVSAGSVTFTGGTTTQQLTIYGNLTFGSGNVVSFSYNGSVQFFNNTASSTNTVTTNGVTLTVASGYIAIFTPVATATIILGSAFTTSGYIYAQGAGTWDTGGYSVSTQQLTSASGSPILNLNSSTITITSYSINFLTPTTLNAGTSTINHTYTSAGLAGTLGGSGTYTFYNLSFATGSQFITTAGNIICNNWTMNSPAAVNQSARILNLGGSLTVNGTFTGSGSAANFRIVYASSTIGTPVTLNMPVASSTISNADFRDITATNTITATGGGDCGGNSNITGFPAAKTVYWNLTGTQYWAANGWAATSGGSPAVSNYPLPQDTAVIDNTGAATTISISAYNALNIGTVDMSNRSTAVTISIGTVFNLYGSWTNGSGTSMSGTSAASFYGRGNLQQVNPAGKNMFAMTVNNIGGIVRLLGSYTITSGNVALGYGTLDLNGYTLTCTGFNGNSTGARTLAFGTGNITVTGTGTPWSLTTTSNLTITGTPIVNVSNNTSTGASVASGALAEASAISFNITTGTYSLTLLGVNGYTAKNIDFTGFSGTWLAVASASIYGSLTLSSGMTLTASSNTLTFAATSGTKTITTNGKTLDFPITFNGQGGIWQFQDALTQGSTRAFTITAGTVKLAAGVTSTVGAFATSGSVMKYLLSSTPGTQATISQASGTVTATYLTIKDSNATGGATWNGSSATNVNLGNNAGWTLPALTILGVSVPAGVTIGSGVTFSY